MIIENTYNSIYIKDKCKFQPPLLSFQAKNIYIGKSRVCPLTQFFGAADNSPDFDGNTLLLEFQNNEYIYIFELEINKFKTDDEIINYISLMGNNMIPYAFIFGEKRTYFLYHRYKIIENDEIEEGSLLNATNYDLDPYNYHVENCGQDSLKKLERSLIHTFWPGVGEDIEDEENSQEDVNINEMEYTYGSNEIVKVFNQNCVICLERDSEFILKHCGHQCTCEQCCQKKSVLFVEHNYRHRHFFVL